MEGCTVLAVHEEAVLLNIIHCEALKKGGGGAEYILRSTVKMLS